MIRRLTWLASAASIALWGMGAARAAEPQALDKACDGGDKDACFAYGEHFREKGDKARAYLGYSRGCAAGRGDACARESDILYSGAPPIPADPVRRNQVLWRGCSLGDGQSCSFLATGYYSPKPLVADKALAVQLYRHACLDLGYADGCASAGSYLADDGQKAVARAFLEEGCKRASSLACGDVKRLTDGVSPGALPAAEDWKAVAERAAKLPLLPGESLKEIPSREAIEAALSAKGATPSSASASAASTASPQPTAAPSGPSTTAPPMVRSARRPTRGKLYFRCIQRAIRAGVRRYQQLTGFDLLECQMKPEYARADCRRDVRRRHRPAQRQTQREVLARCLGRPVAGPAPTATDEKKEALIRERFEECVRMRQIDLRFKIGRETRKLGGECHGIEEPEKKADCMEELRRLPDVIRRAEMPGIVDRCRESSLRRSN